VAWRPMPELTTRDWMDRRTALRRCDEVIEWTCGLHAMLVKRS